MKIKKILTSAIVLFSFLASNAQTDSVSLPGKDGSSLINQNKPGEIYKLKHAVDLPIIAVGAGWSTFAFPKIYSKDPSTEEQILNLKKSDIPSFDRWAAGKSNPTADKNSDFFLYGSIAVPFGLLFDKEIRQDAGKIGLMYLEVMSITGLFYSGTVYFVDRYRPETYNTSIPVQDRKVGNNKDAFIGGHPAVVASTTFFAAKVYADYHPESNFKYVLYGFAVAATGTTAYLRHVAGKHFPSDLAAGITVGTLSGMLVPHFHKIYKPKDHSLGVIPFSDGSVHGLCLNYKFK